MAESLDLCDQFETIRFKQDIKNELLSLAVVKTDQSTWLDGFVTGVGALVAGPHGSSTKTQSHSLLKRELFRAGRVT